MLTVSSIDALKTDGLAATVVIDRSTWLLCGPRVGSDLSIERLYCINFEIAWFGTEHRAT
jgi:hypothetical protein